MTTILRSIALSALSLTIVAGTAAPAGAQLTCDRTAIDPESYELTTTAQAVNLFEPRYGFWDRFIVNEHLRALDGLNVDAWRLAQMALERDPGNLMAHAILARQLTALDEHRTAQDEWKTVFDAGGAVVYTATLYDVDAKSQFLMAFDRDGIRIYREGQFVDEVERRLGVAEFPEPDATAFYEAWAGCPSADVRPEAFVPWTSVKEIRSGNWVLWFKLGHTVAVSSDRGKKKSLNEIKVNLAGQAGHTEFLVSQESDGDLNVRGIGLGPWDYQLALRNAISITADPDRRIKVSSAGRGAGW